MNKLRLSARWHSWVSLTSLLLGIATLAFSQLATQPEPPSGDASAQVTSVRKGLEALEVRMVDVRKAQASLRRRPQTDRLARDLAQARNGVSGLGAAGSVLVEQVAKLTKELARIEGDLDRRQGETARNLSGIEGRLQETKGIFEDTMDNTVGSPDEALPILRVVAENLGRVADELEVVVQLVNVGEVEGGRQVDVLAQQVSGVLDEVAKSRVVGEEAKPPSINAEVTTSAGSDRVSDVFREIEGRGQALFEPGIQSDGGDVGLARRTAIDRGRSEATIEELRTQLESSRDVQTVLSEDTEKLQTDLRRAYREIVSLQTGLKESEHLVNQLEESRISLLKVRGQDASGVEAVSRMVSRLQGELKSAREDLKLSRQSLLSEQERSSVMIRTLSNELERTRKELDSARSVAASSGADTGRLLTLEQELERAKFALTEAKALKVEGDPDVSNKLRDELRKALVELTLLEAELTDKEELESQLVAMRQTIKQMTDHPSRTVSPEYINKLLLELNAAKLAVNEAKTESKKLRDQLSGRIESLGGDVGQSQVDLQKYRTAFEGAREAMARKEFEFASTIKKLEEELQETQVALQEATQGAIRKVPVVGDMERTLADSQERIDALSRRFDKEQTKASELVAALQVELEATKRRHESSLQELAESDKKIQGQGLELQRRREQTAELQSELGEVETIAGQLQQLNDVLDETKLTQNSQVVDADRIISSLREQLNETQVELVFAKEAKEKTEGRSASQVVALEHQLEQTREQLAATQATMYDRTAGSKDLIQNLKGELDAARTEIARLKTMGAGDSVGAQQAVAQLQEALGTIRVLQESIDQSEQVNAEVDGLRFELANAMQSQLADLERSELEKERLRKKVADLDVEIRVLSEEGAGQNVNYAKAFARLNEQFQASQNQVSQLEGRLAQSENSGVGTITALEEQLEIARSRNNELSAQMQKAQQGKGQTVELLERELALTKRKLDALEAKQGADVPEVAELQGSLVTAKLQLDELTKQRDEAVAQSGLVEQLKVQLMVTEAKVAGLESASPSSATDASGRLARLNLLEQELADARKTTSDLQAVVEAKESQRNQMEEYLAKTVMKLEASEGVGQDTANLREQLEQLSLELSLVRSRQASPDTSPNDSHISELRGEIENMKTELELARELSSRSPQNDATVTKLQSQLAEKYGEVLELETELELTKQRLHELQVAPASTVSPVESDELKKLLANQLAQLEAASLAQGVAEKKVSELTAALETSQGLRDELLRLQRDLESAKADATIPMVELGVSSLQTELLETKEALGKSEAQVAQLKALGDDLARLQQDLLTTKIDASQSVNPSEISGLQAELLRANQALTKSEADVMKLNDEFKRSMEDFRNLKNQVAVLEAENARLTATVGVLPSRPGVSDEYLAKERDTLARENATLLAQVQERDTRIRNLRDTMANMTVPGGGVNEPELRGRLLQAESQLDIARSAEQRAKLDFQRSDAELKEANRRLILIDGDLRTARSRVAELETVKIGPVPSIAATIPSPPIRTSVGPAVLNQLQAENARLKRELTLAQSKQGQEVVGREVQELRQKQLIGSMQLEREQVKIADLQKQLQDAKQVKRENYEKDRAKRQRIILQDEELQVARSRVAELEGAVISLREAIGVLRGGGSGDSRIRSLASSPAVAGSGAAVARTYPSSSSGRGVGGGFASTPRGSSWLPRTEPLPLPDRLGRGRRSGFDTRSGVLPARPSVPVARSVPRGEGTLELTATVQFLNNKVRPAGDIEFFVVSEDFDTIVKRAGINIPVKEGIQSSAELWARSVQSGYRYPGVAAHIRNALADANLARIKTDTRGLARVGSLAAGTYHLVGTAPLGRVGVVWSKSFKIDSGRTNELSLDLRDASWAQ